MPAMPIDPGKVAFVTGTSRGIGAAPASSKRLTTTPTGWSQLLKGTFNTMREAARHMHAGGRVIDFSTSVVGMLLPTHGVYAATKAGV
jgi:NAD(P)-dependent dehydrogenase (short-subunit alcohol dehydrogenase family)